jgi:hypothetical protein
MSEEKELKVISVYSTPISPALEEAFKFQEFAYWCLGIGLIVLFQLIFWLYILK